MKQQFDDISALKENKDYIIDRLNTLNKDSQEVQNGILKNEIDDFINEISDFKVKFNSQVQLLNEVSIKISENFPLVDEYLKNMYEVEEDISKLFNCKSNAKKEKVNDDSSDILERIHQMIAQQANDMQVIKKKRDAMLAKFKKIKMNNVDTKKEIIKGSIGNFKKEIEILKKNATSPKYQSSILKNEIGNFINEIIDFKEKFNSQLQLLNEVSIEISENFLLVDEYVENMHEVGEDISKLFNFENSITEEGSNGNPSDILEGIHQLITKQANDMQVVKKKRDAMLVKFNKIKMKNIDTKKEIMKGNIYNFKKEIKVLKESINSQLNSLTLINEKVQKKFPMVETHVQQVHEIKEEISSIFSDIDSYDNSMDDYRSNNLLDDIYQLKTDLTNIIDIQKNKGKQFDDFSNLSKNKKMDVFMMGGFSVGKTTFIKRLLGQAAGAVAATPQTGSMIEHYQSDIRSLSIYFNNNTMSDPDGNEKLGNFIEKYDLEKYFNLQETNWKFKGSGDILFDNVSTNKAITIINELDTFHEIVDRIKWGHKDRESYSILNYLNIFDFPGFEGNKRHEEKILTYIEKYRPDFLIYLLDPDRGIPSKKEFKSLIKTLEILISRGIRINFFWCYQKKSFSNLASEKVFKDEMKSLINETIDGLNFESFNMNIIKEILTNAVVLDARGSKDDKKKARFSVVVALGNTLVDKCNEFLDLLENQDVMFNNTLGVMNELYDYKKELRLSINKLLQKEGIIKYNDLQSTINELFKLNEIKELIKLVPKNEISKVLIERLERTTFKIKKMSPSIIKLFYKNNSKIIFFGDFSGKAEDFNFNYQYAKNDFFDELEHGKNGVIVKWIDTMYESQLLISFLKIHSKVLLSEYYKDIENRIIIQAKKNKEKLRMKLK